MLSGFFTSANHNSGDYKQTIVSPPGAVDRSPWHGTCARLASLFAKGMIGIGETRRFEGVLGTCFEGQVIEARDHQGRCFVTPGCAVEPTLPAFTSSF